MTNVEQVSVALYENVYRKTGNIVSDLWPYEVSHWPIPDIHNWDGAAHKELSNKAKNILELVDNNVDLALAIIKEL